MVHGATGQNLLYVTTAYNKDVEVYSYPGGKHEGTLTGFNSPQGECVDKKGNIWITDFAGSDIVEYAHGGTSPIATLYDTNQDPSGCAIDPKTGDLAATSTFPASGSGAGTVAIYKNASGTPTTYTDPNIVNYYFCGFDTKGNLFVDGLNSSSVEVASFSTHTHAFTNITLDEAILSPGGVQWDNQYLAIGDQGTPIIYEFSISNGVGTEVSSTPLGGIGGSYGVADFFIDGAKVIGPSVSSGKVGFWHYPAGGTPTKLLTVLNEPVGTVVSNAN